jgi:CxxC motif-containing protein (DUF1111 family)
MRIKKVYIITVVICLPAVLMMCRKPGDFSESDYDPRLSGGMATVFDETAGAFGHEVPLLNINDINAHSLGDGAVEQSFVTAPAPVNSGLGPVFSNVSCISCHHNDGKGSPTAGLVNSSLLMRLSLPGKDEHGAPLPIPGFGTQLQDLAVFGKQPEAKVDIQYSYQTINLPGGKIVELRKPIYNLLNPYLPLPSAYLTSPRMAPPFFGLGLLQNISEQTILSFADENDANGDGISGKPNYVWDPVLHKTTLGRFGLKANTATILTQVASAYQQDMGITSSIFPLESSNGQQQADGLNDDFELPDSILQATVFYIKTLAVPARRNVTDPTALAGEQIFKQLNCNACHLPTLQTDVDVTLAAVSHQRIHPYTDLLLHDMGTGLSDGRPDFLANGSEWKTPALWGIGLFQKTNGVPFYLHDGRARTLEEAILWHDGEAAASKQKFMELSSVERDKLIRFIQSL